jgi:hypothetical protein
MTEVVYLDSTTRALGFSVVNPDVPGVWSPSAARFVAPTAADANGKGATPADAIIPFTRLGGANWSTFCFGSANCPDPPPGRSYLILVHPAGGGEPIGEPFPASTPEAGPTAGSLALILR